MMYIQRNTFQILQLLIFNHWIFSTYLIINQLIKIQMQTTSHIFMIRPYLFRSNQQTIANNYYQMQQNINQAENIHAKTIYEFDQFTQILKKQDINLQIIQDDGKFDTPDSIFPNNWISFHQDSNYILYPMYAQNRRLQRRLDYIQKLKLQNVKCIYDYSIYEKDKIYLQGTGSLVLDRTNKIAYAAISPRTDIQLVNKFCENMGYKCCSFKAYQTINSQRRQIYHTNVMMWIGQNIAGICLNSIDNQQQKVKIYQQLKKSGRQVLILKQNQISQFVGNTINLKSNKNQDVFIMSKRAFKALQMNQIQQINKYGKIIYCPLQTIQKYGGGSARCMIAQIFY